MWQQLLSYAGGTLVALIPIANPIGAIPIFYSLTATDSESYRREQARKTARNVAIVLVTFLIGGQLILRFFGISLGVLQISGGLIVAHTAWEMVTAQGRLTPDEHQEAIDKEDISFTPMAVPMISGPGAIGAVIGLSEKAQTWSNYVGCLIGIAAFGVCLYGCLALGEPLIKKLGKNGIGALNRVFGFFILGIAVQFIANGVLALLQQHLPLVK